MLLFPLFFNWRHFITLQVDLVLIEEVTTVVIKLWRRARIQIETLWWKKVWKRLFLKSSSGVKQRSPHWLILQRCPVLLSQAAGNSTGKKIFTKHKVSKPQTCNDEAEESAFLQNLDFCFTEGFDTTNKKALLLKENQQNLYSFSTFLWHKLRKCPWISWSKYLLCACQKQLHLSSQSLSRKGPAFLFPLWRTGSQFFPSS